MGGSLPMIFDGCGASVAGVALAGGMTIDALDGHDGFNQAKGHAGCGVFPALYAVALEAGGLSGREFLLAITLGYELACRTAIAQHSTTLDYHTSGSWVAVAVAARMMGLTRAQTRPWSKMAQAGAPCAGSRPRAWPRRALPAPLPLRCRSAYSLLP